jgi:hypothetical protein
VARMLTPIPTRKFNAWRERATVPTPRLVAAARGSSSHQPG